MHYYRKNIGDYNKRAGRLSLLQNGVYERLRDSIYEREKFPTRAEAMEWTWVSTLDEISCLDFLLARFFDAHPDGRFVDPEIQKDLERYWEFCAGQKEKGGKGGRPAGKAKKAKIKPDGPEQEPGGNPAGLFQNPTVTLETSNQQPVTSNKATTSSGPADTDRCPVGRIVELYREHARSLVQPRVITDATKAQIAARWRQSEEFQSREFWTGFFQRCEASDFLAGRASGRGGGKPFRAGLEWIVKAANFAKIMNGNYENMGVGHEGQDGRNAGYSGHGQQPREATVTRASRIAGERAAAIERELAEIGAGAGDVVGENG